MDEASVGRSIVRTAIFFAVALFIVGGPVYRQVLGGDNILFRNWIMFSSIGLGVIEVRFERLRDDQWEDFAYVDELKRRFGVKEHRSMRLQGEKDLARTEREMCSIFPEETIRVFARMGTRSRGWVELRYVDELACDEILP